MIGLALGSLLSAVLVRTVSPFTEKASLDGTTVLVAALFLIVVTAIAVALPAWRATTINPLSALRDE